MVEIKEVVDKEKIKKEKLDKVNQEITDNLLEQFPYAFRKITNKTNGQILFQAGIRNPNKFISKLSGKSPSSDEMKAHLFNFKVLNDEVLNDLKDTKDNKVYNSVLRLINYESMKNGGPSFSKMGITLPFETADSYIPPSVIPTSLNAFTDSSKDAFYKAMSFVNDYNMLLEKEEKEKK